MEEEEVVVVSDADPVKRRDVVVVPVEEIEQEFEAKSLALSDEFFEVGVSGVPGGGVREGGCPDWRDGGAAFRGSSVSGVPELEEAEAAVGGQAQSGCSGGAAGHGLQRLRLLEVQPYRVLPGGRGWPEERTVTASY